MDASEHDRWWRERGATELRDLLYDEWDPIGLRGMADDSRDEYEAYAGQIVRRLRAGSSEEELAALLESFRLEMGLEPGEPPVAIAHRILDWYRASTA
ncbi:MAG: hypothetical protein QOG63_2307 [Thermoleophilaceae bacterium]|jgi:hypothetical protein|nr:hypothetical protein [Thermoleophilaceae bacterium]